MFSNWICWIFEVLEVLFYGGEPGGSKYIHFIFIWFNNSFIVLEYFQKQKKKQKTKNKKQLFLNRIEWNELSLLFEVTLLSSIIQ